MAVVEHDFNNGLTVKNQTRFADYKRFYQNVYPGSAVSAAGTYTLAAYNNRNDRQNVDQPDRLDLQIQHRHLEAHAGVRNRVRQPAVRQRAVHRLLQQRHGHLESDLGGQPDLVPERHLHRPGHRCQKQDRSQCRGGLRPGSDRTHALAAVHRRRPAANGSTWTTSISTRQNAATFGQTFSRINNLVSPRAGVVIKPVDPLSLYGSYSVSYLPASGDQFGALTSRSPARCSRKSSPTRKSARSGTSPRC